MRTVDASLHEGDAGGRVVGETMRLTRAMHDDEAREWGEGGKLCIRAIQDKGMARGRCAEWERSRW